MGDGVSDLARRGLPFRSGPRMDGKCDACREPLPETGVAWAGPESSRWRWHFTCAPAHMRQQIIDAGEAV